MRRDQTLFIPDKNEAVIGWFQRCGQVPVVVYDYEKLVELFVKDGLDEDEAAEWVSVNIENAWVGQGTPAILYRGLEGFET